MVLEYFVQQCSSVVMIADVNVLVISSTKNNDCPGPSLSGTAVIYSFTATFTVIASSSQVVSSVLCPLDSICSRLVNFGLKNIYLLLLLSNSSSCSFADLILNSFEKNA